METKFQFFYKRDKEASQQNLSGQQVEKRYCPGQNRVSGHFTLLFIVVTSYLNLRMKGSNCTFFDEIELLV